MSIEEPRRRLPRAKRRVSFWPLLVAALFITIVVILLIRQPWNTRSVAELNAVQASTPADARPLVFMSNRDGDWDIYALTPADRTLVNLTQNDADDAFPTYSADGGALTFLSNRLPSDDGRLDAFMMNADGSSSVEVRSDLNTIFTILATGRTDWDIRYRPAISGDAAAPVALGSFVTLRDLNLEVYEIVPASDGSAPVERNISQNAAIDWFSAISPDGTRIAFASDRDNGNQDIYLAENGLLRRLTDDPKDDLYPLWTDDGRLLFYSERAGSDGAASTLAGGAMPLYLLNADDLTIDGTGIPVPHAFDAAAEADALVAGVLAAPGGGQLYMTHADGDWDIYYVDSSGGAPLNLTADDGGADDVFPLWRPVVAAAAQ